MSVCVGGAGRAGGGDISQLRPNIYGLGEKAPPVSTHPEILGQSAPHTGSATQRSTKLRSVQQIRMCLARSRHFSIPRRNAG